MTDEDLVKRLRERVAMTNKPSATTPAMCAEAADAIERLTRERDEAFQKYVDANEARIDAEAKVARLREALTPFAEEAKFCDEQTRVQGMPSLDDDDGVDVNMGDLRRARAVLQETEQ